MTELQILRNKVDTIDSQIRDLLNMRAELALKIAGVKISENPNLKDFQRLEREALILKKVTRHNHGPLDDSAITEIFKIIMAECLMIQNKKYSENNN